MAVGRWWRRSFTRFRTQHIDFTAIASTSYPQGSSLCVARFSIDEFPLYAYFLEPSGVSSSLTFYFDCPSSGAFLFEVDFPRWSCQTMVFSTAQPFCRLANYPISEHHLVFRIRRLFGGSPPCLPSNIAVQVVTLQAVVASVGLSGLSWTDCGVLNRMASEPISVAADSPLSDLLSQNPKFQLFYIGPAGDFLFGPLAGHIKVSEIIIGRYAKFLLLPPGSCPQPVFLVERGPPDLLFGCVPLSSLHTGPYVDLESLGEPSVGAVFSGRLPKLRPYWSGAAIVKGDSPLRAKRLSIRSLPTSRGNSASPARSSPSATTSSRRPTSARPVKWAGSFSTSWTS
jgi:hypothetical protein